jgi:hypothetical protein
MNHTIDLLLYQSSTCILKLTLLFSPLFLVASEMLLLVSALSLASNNKLACPHIGIISSWPQDLGGYPMGYVDQLV